MPKVPKYDPRIVATARIRYLGPENYQIICTDQSGKRFEEADKFESSHEAAWQLRQKMVNQSYSPWKNKS